MRRVEMSDEGHKTNGSEEVDNPRPTGACGAGKDGKDGGEGHGVSEEEDSRVGDDTKKINCIGKEADGISDQRSAHAVERRLANQLQKPNQLALESVFTVRPLKVLLAENDDSTRLVVFALLQNCGYEVVPVANGLQAWKTLEDLANHIDLVLTEVALPGLSGIGLLAKIMSHRTRKSIPVIMMSSHDSMNIVFKCLSKGAVDYLVKPIRKNELRNLWQHAWRRCQSSSGSENSIQTPKSTKRRSLDQVGNDIGSEYEDDIGSTGLNHDGSDNGSGTQSSWTKRATEVGSPQPMSPLNQPAHQTDGTGTQVSQSRPEMLGSNWAPLAPGDEFEGWNSIHVNAPVEKCSDNNVAKPLYLQCEEPEGRCEARKSVGYIDKSSGESCTKDWRNKEKCLDSSTEKPRDDSVCSLPFISIATDPNKKGKTTSMPSDNVKSAAMTEAMGMPSIKHTLRGHQDVKDAGTSSSDQQIFRHSDLSAFSKYNSDSTANQRPTGNVGSCSPGDNSSDAAKTKSMQNHQSVSNNGSSNNNDMGSTTNVRPKNPAAFTDKGKSVMKSPQPSSGVQLEQNNNCLSLSVPVQRKTDTFPAAEQFLDQPMGIDQQNNEFHHYQFYAPYGFAYSMPQIKQPVNHDNASLLCGSSNVPGGVWVEGITGNHSVNGSGSGSHHGSNGQKGCSIGLNPKGRNMETDNTIDERSRGNHEIGDGQRQNRVSHREAALNKFRQKRKERCFEKKIRYQGRKEIAKQRPRVRGQFVQKGGEESNEKDEKS
ncbi:PREDICTED: two-component response regulator-like APRR3 [Tarenaya hassleriana]|uniref:two-component response regulator-like APRR3 n=1 Tax=Tarenaya hassleriana TaxID=28532 RepID=UPI00053C3A0F|nr:PREDICTED: two-component response regulator-like APRR3 [Tarenaya hassleriana]XP_019059329.1 PREDICTED: two-component response regulator-like APRR3 [Tarenaya hassleriana]XP_019059330.1 PREDICTED: two-component response regulator-like APRR3 [Tarenaya hassleriana]